MIRGIIFDFDGLILDTEITIYQSWQEVYAVHGVELRFEDWAKIIGTKAFEFRPMAALEAQLGGEIPDRAGVEQRRLRRELELLARKTVQPGVETCLQDARRLGLKVGLATISSFDWVGGHLERLGLIDYFDCIRTGDDVTRPKPDPEVYLSVLEAFELAPEEAFALEDSPNGVMAAQRAGLKCVAVPNSLTKLLSLEHANLRLESLADLPLQELILRLEGQNGVV
jgi:HAD superfamily hydrolase (TIGR01509 family)